MAESRSLLKVGEGFRQAKSHINILWVHLWIDDPWLIHRTVSYFKVMMMAVTSRETGFHLEALAVEHHICTYLHTYGDTTWRVWMFICFDQQCMACSEIPHLYMLHFSMCHVPKFHDLALPPSTWLVVHVLTSRYIKGDLILDLKKWFNIPNLMYYPQIQTQHFDCVLPSTSMFGFVSSVFDATSPHSPPLTFKRKGRDGGLGPGRGRGRARLPGITGMGWMMLWLQVEKPT